MTLGLVWTNLTSYCLQIGLLIGVAAFIPRALRMAEPRARLAFWHIVLAACLALPLFAPWRQESVTVGVTMHVARPLPSRTVPPSRDRVIPWDRIVLGILATGAVVRFAWLALGLARLRQYRRRAIPLDPPATWGVEADLRISEDVASPVTFGARRPVVLLPAHFRELAPSTQEAILCHEILHVRRRDWLITLTEEVVRSLFWFHPAIWWLLGEIGLSREQAVDREVIEMTRAREEYVDALLAIAGATPRLDLAPAPLFLRKRHLKHRVVSIMKEVRMSKTRSLSSLAASLGFLAAVCWLVTLTFPLSAAPQMVSDGPGVTVDLGNAGVMHRTGIMYPANVRAEGTLLVEATLDSAGNVVDAHVLSGPVELRRNALQSVLQWHFTNDSGANTRQIKITFTTPPATEEKITKLPNGEMTRTIITNGTASEPAAIARGAMISGSFGGMVPPTRPSLAGKTLKQINIQGLTDDARAKLGSRLPVRVGDILSDDTVQRTIAAVREYDEHMVVGTRLDPDGTASLTISAPGSFNGGGSTYAPPPPAPGMRRITIGGNVQQAKLVSQPKPAYPPLAKQARISGTVKLGVVIAADGTMRDIGVISGHPLLIPAALEAVRLWRYSPTLLNGEPVEVATQIDVNFTLSDEPPQQ
ncbi:MAG TPA: M56 family metallopeptidase [Candidatus Acidoferrum sp.]|nr:M56 family metallopeptidase [Candidatus Acidoferrum sp.]